jgi:hypothetical protein
MVCCGYAEFGPTTRYRHFFCPVMAVSAEQEDYPLQPSIFPQTRTDTVYGNGTKCTIFLQVHQFHLLSIKIRFLRIEARINLQIL